MSPPKLVSQASQESGPLNFRVSSSKPSTEIFPSRNGRWVSISGSRKARTSFGSAIVLFHIKTQLLHGGPIVDREQDRVAARGILVLVPFPGRQREQVALVPLQPLALDHRGSFALEDAVKGGAVVA